MSDTTTPTPAPQVPSSQPPQVSKTAGWVGLFIAFVVISWIVDMAGCNGTTTMQSSAHVLTKAEWRQKALPYYNPNGGPVKRTTITSFKSVMGEPSNTQTIDGEAFWFYDCSDGTIQIKLIDPAMSGGEMAIQEINEF